jgi:hypothetical protein
MAWRAPGHQLRVPVYAASVFGNLDSRKGAAWRPEDYKLSDLMQTFWTNFSEPETQTALEYRTGLPATLDVIGRSCASALILRLLRTRIAIGICFSNRFGDDDSICFRNEKVFLQVRRLIFCRNVLAITRLLRKMTHA